MSQRGPEVLRPPGVRGGRESELRGGPEVRGSPIVIEVVQKSGGRGASSQRSPEVMSEAPESQRVRESGA